MDGIRVEVPATVCLEVVHLATRRAVVRESDAFRIVRADEPAGGLRPERDVPGAEPGPADGGDAEQEREDATHTQIPPAGRK